MPYLAKIWSVGCQDLDDSRLLAEHKQLHGIWLAHTKPKLDPRYFPENFMNFWNSEDMLRKRHAEQVAEFKHRGWNHNTPLIGAFRPPKRPSRKRYVVNSKTILRDRLTLRKRWKDSDPKWTNRDRPIWSTKTNTKTSTSTKMGWQRPEQVT